MLSTNRILAFILGVMAVLFLCGCVNDVGKMDERIETRSESMTEETSMAVKDTLNIAEQQEEEIWTEQDAADYYEELIKKMQNADYQSKRWPLEDYCLSYPELKVLCKVQGIERPEGFDGELPEISEEAAEEILAKFIRLGDMRKLEDGTYELTGNGRQVLLPVVAPYYYIKGVSENGKFWVYYFHDTSLSGVEYDLYGTGVGHCFEYDEDAINLAYVFHIDYPTGYTMTNFGEKAVRYLIVNCKTGEETEYYIESDTDHEYNMKEDAMIKEVRKQSESIGRVKNPKMIYECIRGIMDMVGTDVNGAKLLYEDSCWGTGTDVESIESYDTETKTLLVKGTDLMEYECLLDEDGDIKEIYEKGGECVFCDDSKVEQPGKRKKSLIDLSILKKRNEK